MQEQTERLIRVLVVQAANGIEKTFLAYADRVLTAANFLAH